MRLLVCTSSLVLLMTCYGQEQVPVSRSVSYLSVDLGVGLWLEEWQSPSEYNAPYATRPWGSWSVGANWTTNTTLAKSLYIDWGGGVTWMNWQLEDSKFQIIKGDRAVEFVENLPENASSIKSKLSATYIGVHLIPMLDLGDKGSLREQKDGISKKGISNGFRIGIGPYIGYRLGSRSKYVYSQDSKREQDKQNDHFYLENTRYGLRGQLGFREFELYVASDLNYVFAPGKGPNRAYLNNLVIGITLAEKW